ncbi:MAG: hypothetical protein EA419_00460 [Wenzhouxiangella sp.]|nr:MAG: hypothetical protein EA419_00460 [Wenzhouxiangella sp.]
MKKPSNVESSSVADLRAMLQASGEQQCAAVRAEGAKKIAELRRKAFAQARARVRAAVRDERARMSQALGRVEAEVETAVRRRTLAHDARVLAEGRERLAEVLAERWQKTSARRIWAATLLVQAAGVIHARQWRIECPSDWPDAERSETIELGAERHQARIEVHPVAGLDVGLRLISGGIAVDMSLTGLLADRDRIDGALLDLFTRVDEGESE